MNITEFQRNQANKKDEDGSRGTDGSESHEDELFEIILAWFWLDTL